MLTSTVPRLQTHQNLRYLNQNRAILHKTPRDSVWWIIAKQILALTPIRIGFDNAWIVYCVTQWVANFAIGLAKNKAFSFLWRLYAWLVLLQCIIGTYNSKWSTMCANSTNLSTSQPEHIQLCTLCAHWTHPIQMKAWSPIQQHGNQTRFGWLPGCTGDTCHCCLENGQGCNANNAKTTTTGRKNHARWLNIC